MLNLPFNKDGRFYRGNLHTHSNISDGALSPQDVCGFYRTAGYDFLALTDHFLEQFDFAIADTRSFRTDNFTTIIGAELHTGKTELGHLWHILAVGLPLDFAPPAADETGPQIAARALEAGAYVAAAHPAWYMLTEEDILSLGSIHAIEVYNGATEELNDQADSWYIAQLLLMRGEQYNICATDDAHFGLNNGNGLQGWVHVKAESASPEDLLAALKAGQYYSSTGPQIHDVQVYRGEKVIVKCSPATRVLVVGHAAVSSSKSGQGLQEVELSLEHFRHSSYGRIIVIDEHGKRAWTNPFWFD